MRLRPVLAVSALTLAVVVGGASTATAATEPAKKPIDSTITLTLEAIAKIDPVLVAGCVVDHVASPPALVNCLLGK